ncbi:hypothetical protein [Providencia rettgeri]|uniref:hypothetical protein n=1 Tax=Providencia rettgeri TaxID=587 RepID=UPI0018E42224|nr:hypothetical protein [Providencia rettgeri]MBI6191811.1 hypothetical protein [Providencia rettgeri]UPQ40672.1 hypothetical protein LV777_06730 [Providencia rettgeri]
MSFDWVAGTALVVGIGSLYLTYQSTKSAKKSIDTSIHLYEKQKKDDERKKEKENVDKLNAIKVMLREEIKDNYFLFVNVYKVMCSVAKNPTLMVMTEKFNDDCLVELPDGTNAIFKSHQYDNINRYLFDVLILDKEISKVMIELKVSSMLYKAVSDPFVSLLRSKDFNNANKLIGMHLNSITKYKLEMESLYEKCSDKDTISISDYLSRLP